MNLSDELLMEALQRLLGAPRRGRGTDPFDWFLRSCLRRAPTTRPLVVWNLGGAADAEHWPRAVQSALACARDAGSRWPHGPGWDVDWPTTPIVYGEFGHWTRRFRFDVSGWRQYAFLDATDARRLARTPELPIGNRIASAAVQATVVGSLLVNGPPLLVVYLHVDNRIAWAEVLSRLERRADMLISTCRGTSCLSLEPSAGEEATLWADLHRLAPRLLPPIWCCDAQIFSPPRGWDVRRAPGEYASPGVALRPLHWPSEPRVTD